MNGPHLENTGERMIPEFHGGTLMYGEHYTRYLVAMEMVAGRRVLDIASGSGYGSQMLAQRALSVVGVDVDADAVAYASGQFPAPNLEFKLGDGTAIPLADDSVDVVVSFETIEHIEDYRAFIAEVDRVLAPGGVLLLSTPNDLEVPKGNHFHIHEFCYDELVDVVRPSFPHVVSYYQATYKAVMVGTDDLLRQNGPVEVSVINQARLGADNVLFFYLVCTREPTGATITPVLDLAEHFSYRAELAPVQAAVTFANAAGQELALERVARQAAERRALAAEQRARAATVAPREHQDGAQFAATVIVSVGADVERVARCLGALAENTDPAAYEVVVVDRAGDPQVGALLDSLEGDVRVVRSVGAQNPGVAWNAAAAGATSKVLVFVRDEVEVLAHWLDPLLTEIERTGAGVVGPRLITPQMTVQNAGYLLFEDGRSDVPLGKGIPYEGVRWDDPTVARRRELDAVSGALMAVRRGSFDSVGGFDEGFAEQSEDVDLCLKLRQAGSVVVYQPASVVIRHETPVAAAEVAVTDGLRLARRWAGRYVPEAVLGANDTAVPNPRRRSGRAFAAPRVTPGERAAAR